MKVKCVKIINPATGCDLGSRSPWLTVGDVYTVLALTMEAGIITRVLLESNENAEPKDFYFNQFEVIDDSAPKSWVARTGGTDIEFHGPEILLEDDFWERFDDGDERARNAYIVERRKIVGQ